MSVSGPLRPRLNILFGVYLFFVNLRGIPRTVGDKFRILFIVEATRLRMEQRDV